MQVKLNCFHLFCCKYFWPLPVMVAAHFLLDSRTDFNIVVWIVELELSNESFDEIELLVKRIKCMKGLYSFTSKTMIVPKVENRPITSNGLAGFRPATTQQGRITKDRLYLGISILKKISQKFQNFFFEFFKNLEKVARRNQTSVPTVARRDSKSGDGKAVDNSRTWWVCFY